MNYKALYSNTDIPIGWWSNWKVLCNKTAVMLHRMVTVHSADNCQLAVNYQLLRIWSDQRGRKSFCTRVPTKVISNGFSLLAEKKSPCTESYSMHVSAFLSCFCRRFCSLQFNAKSPQTCADAARWWRNVREAPKTTASSAAAVNPCHD